MSRIARVVAPGYPHHIIQRGNRRQQVFFSDKDKFVYLKFFRQQSCRYGLECWAYCLMDNHVHFVVVPKNKDSFRAVAETNRRYTQMVNYRQGWRGYLWQGRFTSFVMDEHYCYEAVRYVENNPVRASMVLKAEDYRFSSAGHHVYKKKDTLVSRCFLDDGIKDWKLFLREDGDRCEEFRKHERTGRPLGAVEFLIKLEHMLGIRLRKNKPGPKPGIER
jgi:putative transposase